MRRKTAWIVRASACALVGACGTRDPSGASAPPSAKPVPDSEPLAVEQAKEPVATAPPRSALPPRWPTSAAAAPVEEAVLGGLGWLARHQAADGSWTVESARERCSPGKSCFDADLKATHAYDEGLTGLALLAFLDAGFTHESKYEFVDKSPQDRRYEAGVVVARGLEWLKKRQRADGSFSRDEPFMYPFMYSEALATAAFVEAFRQTRNRYWTEPAQRGVDFLEAAQRPDPSGTGLWGWRYAPRQVVEARIGPLGIGGSAAEIHDADTSATASCFLALVHAEAAGLQVKRGSLEGALEFCEFVTGKNGLVGYLDAKSAGSTITGPFDDRFTYHPTTLSALGMSIRLLGTGDFEDPFLQLGAKRIVGDLPWVAQDRSSIDYSYWHHATLALQMFDGESSPVRRGRFWSPWSQALLEAVLQLQSHSEHDGSDGGWLASDRWGSYSGAGPLYNTAMNVRTLAIWLNALPIVPSKHPLIGAPAPDFEAVDEPRSRSRMSDLRGRVVLVDFLSPSAPGFAMDLEARSTFARRMKAEPLTILTVCLNTAGVDQLPSPMARAELPWTCVLVDDANDPILQEYKVRTFPTTIVVDQAGIVRGAPSGWDDTVLLANRLLAEPERKHRPR